MYSREIDGQILTLSSSGWTYVYTFVLYDYETESMWFPVNGGPSAVPGTCGCGLLCIAGEFAGRMLENRSSVMTSWKNWVSAFPGSKIMKEPEAE